MSEEVIDDRNLLPKDIELVFGGRTFTITEPTRRTCRKILKDLHAIQQKYINDFIDEDGNPKNEDLDFIQQNIGDFFDCMDEMIDLIAPYVNVESAEEIEFIRENATEKEIEEALPEFVKLVDPTAGEEMEKQIKKQSKKSTPKRSQKRST